MDIKNDKIHCYDLNIINSIFQFLVTTHLLVKHKKLKNSENIYSVPSSG